jgi:hypothetical protein
MPKLRRLIQFNSVTQNHRCRPLVDLLQGGHLLPAPLTMIGKLLMQRQQDSGDGRKSSVRKPDVTPEV